MFLGREKDVQHLDILTIHTRRSASLACRWTTPACAGARCCARRRFRILILAGTTVDHGWAGQEGRILVRKARVVMVSKLDGRLQTGEDG